MTLHLSKAPRAINAGQLALGCTWTGHSTGQAADAVLMVTSRRADAALYHATRALDWRGAGIVSLQLIGDAAAPAPIAWATYAGRRYAEDLDAPDTGDALAFRREIAALSEAPRLTP